MSCSMVKEETEPETNGDSVVKMNGDATDDVKNNGDADLVSFESSEDQGFMLKTPGQDGGELLVEFDPEEKSVKEESVAGVTAGVASLSIPNIELTPATPVKERSPAPSPRKSEEKETKNDEKKTSAATTASPKKTTTPASKTTATSKPTPGKVVSKPATPAKKESTTTTKPTTTRTAGSASRTTTSARTTTSSARPTAASSTGRTRPTAGDDAKSTKSASSTSSASSRT